MVKIKIEKWGSLEGLSISISKQFMVVLFVLILVIIGLRVPASFLKFLTHYY